MLSDTYSLVSTALAAKYSLSNGDVVSLEVPSGRLVGPVLITPGQADGTLSVHLGYGRTESGHVGTEVGLNAYAARTSAAQFWAPVSSLSTTGKRHSFAITQGHQTLAGRDIIQE